MPPDDRRLLETLPQRASLLDLFTREPDAHGAAYAHHHHRLVKAFVESPSQKVASAHSAGITSSGPSLDEVMSMLQRLLELRTSRYSNEAFAKIRATLSDASPSML